MASFTAKASGNWSSGSQTTWNEVGTPGNGDTVTIGINATIIVDVNTTIGSSGASGTASITMSGTSAQLVIAGGVTLTYRGDILVQGNAALITMNAGSSLLHDSSASASPSTTQYKIDPSGNSAQIVINGTSGQHCTISSVTTGGSLFGYMNFSAHVFNGCKTCTYADFSNFGDSTHDCLFMYFGTTTNAVTIDHCTFTTCGQVEMGAGSAGSGYSLTYTNNIHKSSTGAVCFKWSAVNVAIGAGTRLCQSNYFDLGITLTNGRDATIDGNVILGSIGSLATTNAWAAFSNNLVYWNPAGSSALMTAVGNVTNCYLANSFATNPHYVADQVTQSVVITGVIAECVNTANDGQGDFYVLNIAPGSAWTCTIQNCILLPTQGSVNSAGVLLTITIGNVNSGVALNHNTVCVGGQPGFSLEETNLGVAGVITSIQNNIFWTREALSATHSYKGWSSTHPASGGTQDIVSPTNCDYNACGGTGGVAGFHVEKPSVWSGNTYGQAGNSYQWNASAYPGAHDLNNVDPLFEDSSRNMGTWYTKGLGNTTTGTYIGDVNAAATYIGQAPQTAQDSVKTRIQALWNWVGGGFVPTAKQYNFTYPGDTNSVTNVGAVQGVFESPGGFMGANRTMGTYVKASTSFVGVGI